MPIPSGNVTFAVFRYELAIGSFASNGIPTSTVVGSGESTVATLGGDADRRFERDDSQPVAPVGVV